jgi:hypothetical protein
MLQHHRGRIEPSRLARGKLPPSTPPVDLPLEGDLERQLVDLPGSKNGISAMSRNRHPVGSEGNFAIRVRSLCRDGTTDLAIRSLRSATEFALAVARLPENAVASS